MTWLYQCHLRRWGCGLGKLFLSTLNSSGHLILEENNLLMKVTSSLILMKLQSSNKLGKDASESVVQRAHHELSRLMNRIITR